MVERLANFAEPLFSGDDEEEIQMLSKVLFYIETIKPKLTIELLEIMMSKTNGSKKSHIKGFYPLYIYRVLNEIKKALYL